MAARSFALPAALLVAAALWSACGGDPFGPPTQVAASSTTSFAGVVGSDVAEPLVVRVTDAEGRPVPGVVVDYQVTEGGGSLAILPGAMPTASRGLSLSGSAVLVTDSTDINGEVSAEWTLGTAAGEQTVVATVQTIGDVTFTAEAEADVPFTSGFLSSSAFVGPSGQNADQPLNVRVLDEYDNPVEGVTVTWAALDPGASVAAGSSTTDSNGAATVEVTLGADHGVFLYSATAGGLDPDTIGVLSVVGSTEPSDGTDPGGTGLVSHDVRFFGGAIADSILFLYYEFADNVVGLPVSGGAPSNAVVGWVDIDADQDSTTGFQIARQCFGFGDPLGFGADLLFDLNPLSSNLAAVQGAVPGMIPVMRTDSVAQADPCAGTVFIIASQPFYRGNVLVVFAPLAFTLDADGQFDMSSFMANGATFGVTDIVPDSLGFSFDLTTVSNLVDGGARESIANPTRFLVHGLEMTAPVAVRVSDLQGDVRRDRTGPRAFKRTAETSAHRR